MRPLRLVIILAALALLPSGTAGAIDVNLVPPPKRTRANLYLTAGEVPPFIEAGKGKTLFIDVRTPPELTAAGSTPLADANIPSHGIAGAPGGINPDFAALTGKLLAAKSLTKDDPVILICRSGNRSAAAADMLAAAGFTRVYTVVDGFEGDAGPDGRRTVNGWKNKGLPWSYAAGKAAVTSK